MRRGKNLSEFKPDDIPDSDEVLQRRNPDDLLSFKTVKRTFKKIVEKPKEIVHHIGTSLGIITPKSAIKPTKSTRAKAATKPIKSTSPKKPRRR